MLTVLCITRFDDYTEPFLRCHHQLAAELGAAFVIGADGRPPGYAMKLAQPTVYVESKGFVESVLDQVIECCADGHILRLDDDETVSPALRDWLLSGDWETHDHWAFPRMNLWGDAHTYIASSPLWPDLQTRLSSKAKSGNRPLIHQGSPHGTGRVAPVPILHHKFLVRRHSDREQLVEHYNRVQPGAGTGWLPFSVPELYDFETAAVAA